MFFLNSEFEAFQDRMRNLALPEHHFADQLRLATQAHGGYAQSVADLIPDQAATALGLAFPNGLADYFAGAHSTLLDQVDRITLSRRQLLDSVGAFTDPSELFRHQFQQPLAGLAESSARAIAAAFPVGIPDYVFDAQEMLAGHLGRLTEATQGISAVDLQASVIGWNKEHLRELLETFNSQFVEMALRSVRVDNAGRLMVDDEELDRGEVDAATMVLSGEASFSDFLAQVLALLPKLSKPVAWFLLNVLVSYFVSIAANRHTPFWESLWDEMTGQTPRVVRKQILRDVRERFVLEELRDYRFTSASELHVRAAGKRSASILDSLPMGKTVRVLQRDRDWTEIEYETRDDGNRTGWVFSRYLRRFDR